MAGAGAATSASSERGHPLRREWSTPADLHNESRGEEFISEWEVLNSDVDRITDSVDIEERLNHDILDRAWDVAERYPEFLTVRHGLREEFEDNSSHLNNHFDNLFNRHTNASTELFPHNLKPEIEHLLKAAELVYIHDSISRFSERTRFEPEIGRFEALDVNTLPGELAEWLESVEVVWHVINGRLAYSAEVSHKNLIDELYGYREPVIDKAKELDTFMLITPDELEGGDRVRSHITTRIRRNEEVDPEYVHRYVFNRLVEFE